MKELIKISLTEFMNFVNKSGSAKATVVRTAKKRRDEDYEHFTDYWLDFREELCKIHKKKKSKEEFDEFIKTIPKDKVSNYQLAIDGYKKFWGRKKIEWVNIYKKTWAIGDLRIALNPELGLVIDEKIYVIKLFFSSTETLDKKHADLILTLMEKELREKVGGEGPIFAVLDVKKGKLFEKKDKELKLYSLLKGEAQSFESQWKDIK